MDENNTRVQCLVVVEGKVAGTGTVAEVREQWGDLDTFGKVHKGRGVKVIYLKRGQTVLPGLCVVCRPPQVGECTDGTFRV